MQNTAFNSRAFRCPAFEPMFPLMGGVESAYAVGFDGSNDYIDLGSPSALQITGDITFSFWVKRNGASDFEWVFVNEDSNGYPGVATILFYNSVFNNGSGSKTIYFYRGNGSNAQGGVISASTIPVGVWTHIACTCSGTTYSIYINGQINNTATYAGTVTAKSQFVIGKRIAGANGWHFPGVIDDFRIYSRALTAAEVQSIYRNSSSPPTDGLVFYLPLDEGTGTTVTDTVGGLTGTFTNGPTWQPQVCPRLRSGRDTTQSWGVSLVGASSHYVVSTSSPLNPSATNFTASAWVKFTGVATQQVILSQLDGSGTGATWLELTSGAKLQTAIGGSNLTGATSLVANVWYHVALQQSGTTSTLYLNGTADGTATRTPAAASGVIRIGTSKAGANYMTGNAKSVRIDNSALSAADIAKLANNQSITATPVGHWKLDEGSGTTATDSSGNGNHGTLTNGPTYTGDIPQWFRPTIESSYAGSFDGVDDRIDLASPGTITSHSILAFVKTSESTNFSGFVAWQKNSPLSISQVGITGSGTMYLWWQLYSNGSQKNYYSTLANISDNTWRHIGGTYNAITDVLSLAVNGVIDGSPTKSVDHALTVSFAPDYGRIGVERTGGIFMSGLIDDVCLYNIALPAAAIADAAAGYLVRAGLVSRYKLDNNANDAHGTNNGTEQGGVGYSTSVPGTL